MGRGAGISLYPAQEEALIEVVSGSNVILSTPTGSGKSLVAAGAHFAALARDEVTFYTAPIKALVSEKFFELCKLFGTENVGMLTGDASVNADAPVICCTAEVLASIALRDGKDADIGQVVMDEFHFYAEPDRGWAWQIPLLELDQAQFVLMSATLGDVTRFEEDLTRRTGRPTSVVRSATRPVPLSYEYRATPLTETLTELLETRQAPVYIVHFTQAAAVERAQALMSINMCTRRRRTRSRRSSETSGSPPSSAGTCPAMCGTVSECTTPGCCRSTGGWWRNWRRRAAEGHLRYGHLGRGRQRAHPHGLVHRADEVRRPAGADAAGQGVPPDRRPRRAGRVRHRRLCRGAGARARHREREGAGEGRGRSEKAAQGGA
ncbi:DEAD/DEAH box helicase [Streptomyces sp. FXJ1.4098]|nr:DEAD/DEAH box helicase [Streptomyces sp. FXJ1.4098]